MRRARYHDGLKLQGDWIYLALELLPEQEQLRVRTLLADRFTVSRHACLLAACFLVVVVLFCLCFVCFLFVSFAGSYVDAFLNSASMDMTATVSSNAALGKKFLVLFLFLFNFEFSFVGCFVDFLVPGSREQKATDFFCGAKSGKVKKNLVF